MKGASIAVVEGRQGCGKTTFFKKLVVDESKKGRPTLYISFSELETNNWEIKIGE